MDAKLELDAVVRPEAKDVRLRLGLKLKLMLILELEALVELVAAAPPIVVNELVGPLRTKMLEPVLQQALVPSCGQQTSCPAASFVAFTGPQSMTQLPLSVNPAWQKFWAFRGRPCLVGAGPAVPFREVANC